MRRRAALLLCLGLAACGPSRAGLHYAPASPPAAPAVAQPVIFVAQVTDRRAEGQAEPGWIGAVLDDAGRPVKRLLAPVPVAEEVRRAFADALLARGLLAADATAARYGLEVEILTLNAEQRQRRAAFAEFRITLRLLSGGVPVLVDQERAGLIGSSAIILSAGAFSSTEELQQLARQAMSEAIDRLLDKPGFRAALQ